MVGLAGECCSVLAAEMHEGWEQDKLIFPRGFAVLASRGGSAAIPRTKISPATQAIRVIFYYINHPAAHF